MARRLKSAGDRSFLSGDSLRLNFPTPTQDLDMVLKGSTFATLNLAEFLRGKFHHFHRYISFVVARTADSLPSVSSKGETRIGRNLARLDRQWIPGARLLVTVANECRNTR
jgi:hypothetical protein